MSYSQLGLTKTEIVNSGGSLLWKGEKDMTTYEQFFETPFINDSKQYYHKKSAGWLQTLNCPEYLKEADEYLRKEETRADENFDPQTKYKILNTSQ